MRTHHLFIFAAILFITWAASCTKTTTAPVIATDTVVNAQIATIRTNTGSSDTANYRIVYNAQNQVDSIIESSGFGTVSVTTFIYNGSSYLVLNSGSSGYQADSVTLNPDGTINTIRSGYYYETYYFSYNTNGLSQRDEIYSTEQIFTNYVWVNGDIDSSYTTPVNSGGSGSEIYYYDLRHHWQMGDAISINDFLAYGRPTVHSKHLMTQTSNNSSPTQYAYKFDSRGRITQLTQNGMIYYYTYTN